MAWVEWKSPQGSSSCRNTVETSRKLGKTYLFYLSICYFFIVLMSACVSAESIRRLKFWFFFCNLQFYSMICLNDARGKAIFIEQLSKEYVYIFNHMQCMLLAEKNKFLTFLVKALEIADLRMTVVYWIYQIRKQDKRCQNPLVQDKGGKIHSSHHCRAE